jgi:SAM-dependent methyltransferase
MPVKDYRYSHQTQNHGRLYDKTFGENRAGFYWHCYEKPFLQSLFAEMAKTHKGPVLDFACGTGRITELLNECFTNVTGIDISEEMLKSARAKLPEVAYIKADVTKDNVDIGKFSVVTAFRFFLNAQPELRAAALEWIKSHLEDDGILLVNNHFRAESLKGGLVRFLQKLNLADRNTLSDAEFSELLAQHGFNSEKVFSFCLLPGGQSFPPLNHSLYFKLEKMLWRIADLRQFSEQSIYICTRKRP